jgi:hypothetical protein
MSLFDAAFGARLLERFALIGLTRVEVADHPRRSQGHDLDRLYDLLIRQLELPRSNLLHFLFLLRASLWVLISAIRMTETITMTTKMATMISIPTSFLKVPMDCVPQSVKHNPPRALQTRTILLSI